MTATQSLHGRLINMPSTKPYTLEVANTVINMFSNQHWSSSKPQSDYKAAIDD